MTPRQNRLVWLIAGVAALIMVAVFVVNALRDNMVFFYTPSEIKAGRVAVDQYVRIGGIVVPGSIQRQPDGISIRFDVSDAVQALPVIYRGALPDLFQAGKGAVAQGVWDGSRFRATEVLAKHDENSMPPEAQEALDRQGGAGAMHVAQGR